MRGYELQRARQLRRTELRRELRAALGAGTAMDLEDLMQRVADTSATTWASTLRERLIFLGLQVAQIPDDAVATAWGITRDELRARRAEFLIDPEHRAADVDGRVLLELPEQPEPGRYVKAQI